QASAPIEVKFRGLKRAQNRMGDGRRLAWRRTEPPNDARTLCEKWLNGADLGPEGLSLCFVETRAPPDPRFEGCGRVDAGRPGAFKAHSRRGGEARRHNAHLRTARCGGWQ